MDLEQKKKFILECHIRHKIPGKKIDGTKGGATFYSLRNGGKCLDRNIEAMYERVNVIIGGLGIQKPQEYTQTIPQEKEYTNMAIIPQGIFQDTPNQYTHEKGYIDTQEILLKILSRVEAIEMRLAGLEQKSVAVETSGTIAKQKIQGFTIYKAKRIVDCKPYFFYRATKQYYEDGQKKTVNVYLGKNTDQADQRIAAYLARKGKA